MKHLLRPCLTLALAGTVIALPHGYSYSGHKWGVREVNYYINPANNDVTAAAAIAAIQAAAAAWSTQSNAGFTFYYMGQTSATTLANNGKNEVFFRAGSDSNLAETYRYWNSAGNLVDSDIVFYDGSFKFFGGTSGCSSGFYIQEVATHEFGHALGLNHSNVSTATMYAGAPVCATWKSSLDPDDIAGVEALYPPGAAANAAPSVSITKPANSASYVEATLIAFAGAATDLEDGSLSSKLVWTSSRDGQIGTGASFSRVLSVGSHTITATVKDSAGHTSVRQVSTVVTSTTTNTAPTVTISAPSNLTTILQGTALTFTGSASDKEDGSLTSKLAWTSNLSGTLGVGGSFSRVLSAGTHTIKASVTDSRGLTTLKQLTVTVTASTNKAPSVAISSPANLAIFPGGKAILFAGSATDTEDGSLTAKLSWRSNLDGAIGVGGSFSKVLRNGAHVIEASVRDSAGVLVSKKVSITVGSPILLTATAGTRGNNRWTNLKWSGATTTNVDVYRNSLRIVTANDGTYVDTLPNGTSGTVKYKVCAAGSSTCSAVATVIF